MLMDKIATLIHQPSELLTELSELVIKRCACDRLLRIVYFHLYVTIFQHYGETIAVIKDNICHTDGVSSTAKLKLSMDDIAGIQTP